MKRLVWVVGLAVVLLAGSTLSAEARGWHGGGGWHGGWRGGPRVYVGVGPGWWGPGWWGAPYPYYYPYYDPYYAPYYAAPPQAPSTYIQQAPASVPGAPSAQQSWYYCQNPQGYYPYVKDCPAGWTQVAPQPPTAPPAP